MLLLVGEGLRPLLPASCLRTAPPGSQPGTRPRSPPRTVGHCPSTQSSLSSSLDTSMDPSDEVGSADDDETLEPE